MELNHWRTLYERVALSSGASGKIWSEVWEVEPTPVPWQGTVLPLYQPRFVTSNLFRSSLEGDNSRTLEQLRLRLRLRRTLPRVGRRSW